ncbi:S-adenosyl-L-methionine-dependent methyltransferase [Decorospora gaudefroyi]|uniref:S-adenosyl-L-methionine-dependent methyltransferase n=1 Tax=Decorospora gaudefroyi TaxID=184978 RepID=A0A6A5K178_9PLEO|nr:S-adenosyl-L-methionine-dependent methyltransferase [Decorospora gaudefroyi]
MSSQTPIAFTQKLSNLFLDDDTAKRYKNAENVTRPFAKSIVDKSGLPQLDGEAHVLDLGCGTGVVIQAVYDAVPKGKWGQLKVLGGDVSLSMLEYLGSRGKEQGWTGLETQVIDGNANIDLPKESFTHIFVSFTVFAIPDVLPQLFRLLRPGGFIAITTWVALGWYPYLQSSMSQLDSVPYSPTHEEVLNMIYSGRPWGEQAYLSERLTEAGFEGVQTVGEKVAVRAGTPSAWMQNMEFPLKIMVGVFENWDREGWLEELSRVVMVEAVKAAGGEDGQVPMDCDVLVAWGRKRG